MTLPDFTSYFGVDFSGAVLAGRNAWVARCEPSRSRLALRSLDRLEDLAGTAERGPALAHLVTLVCQSSAALWGMDFPFGLPLELFPKGHRWPKVFDFVGGFGDDAYECGMTCVRRVRRMRRDTARKTRHHIRRQTDAEARAPFDTFHYRLIYQTFFGIRDVIGPLRRSKETAVLPFQYRKLSTAERVVVECCPSSVLKRVGLPHQNYKQPNGGPLTAVRKRVRHRLLGWLAEFVDIPDGFRRVVMRNPGGDALDAVIAAVGAARAVTAADHAAIAAHPRYRREGRMYV